MSYSTYQVQLFVRGCMLAGKSHEVRKCRYCARIEISENRLPPSSTVVSQSVRGIGSDYSRNIGRRHIKNVRQHGSNAQRARTQR